MIRAAPVVTTDWLADRLGLVKVIDATFFLPGQGDAAESYRAGHIPGAVFFDIDAVADPSTSLPHMLPSPEAFAAAVSAMGISQDDHVVVYGAAAPRVWWTFRVFGHDTVSVLDGGLARWQAKNRPVETGEPPARYPSRFPVRFRPELVSDFGAVSTALKTGWPVIDARPAARFHGQAPEPRPGLRSGHMPGAVNLPSASLIGPDGGFLRQAATLALFAEVDLSEPITATCGSGVTAAAVAFALARLGVWNVRVYDGSWAEWGARPDAEVVAEVVADG